MTVATNVDRSVLEAVDVASIGTFPLKATIRSLKVVSLTDGSLSVRDQSHWSRSFGLEADI